MYGDISDVAGDVDTVPILVGINRRRRHNTTHGIVRNLYIGKAARAPPVIVENVNSPGEIRDSTVRDLYVGVTRRIPKRKPSDSRSIWVIRPGCLDRDIYVVPLDIVRIDCEERRVYRRSKVWATRRRVLGLS